MTKDQDFIRRLAPPSGQLSDAEGARATLLRVARPLACSVAIHLGLGAVVVAGSAALGTPQITPIAWLDLEPAVIPPEAPVPIAAAPRPRPARPAPIEPRAPEPLQAPTPITPPVPEERVAPPAPPSMAATPEPPPSPSVTSGPASSTASSAPPSPVVAAESKASDPDGLPLRSAAPGGPSSDVKTSRDNQDTGRPPVVASRPPDASPGAPIVRAARPRGGYQVRPLYPEAARRAGIQGTTMLRIFIERDGRVSDVTVQRSAGDQSLDQAASDAVRRWRFEPALNSAGPVAMWAVVPVEFRISDRD
jgi:protein TonB